MSSTSHAIQRRICIWYEYKLGNSGTTAKENLNKVFGDAAPSQSNIWKWYKKFEREMKAWKLTQGELTLADLAERFGVGSSTIRNHLDNIAKGKKSKFVGKKHEEPISAIRLISKPEKKRYYPGAVPQRFRFRSRVVPEADPRRPLFAEEAQDSNANESMASESDELREWRNDLEIEKPSGCTETMDHIVSFL